MTTRYREERLALRSPKAAAQQALEPVSYTHLAVYKRQKLHSVPSGGFLTDRATDKKPILDVRELGIDFGGLTAGDGFNLMIGRNEITGLIGPNGAGKTTVFNLLTNCLLYTSRCV